MKTVIENNQPLVVCLHGSASSSRQWAGLKEILQDHVRVISPDLVGYSDSSPFKKGQLFSMDDEVANIMRQIEKLTGKRNGPLHLVAHSYGGAVALQIALKYPERVASLSLYEPAQFRMLLADGPDSDEGEEIMAIRQRVGKRLRVPFGKARGVRCH
jgi:pimeloyl-ACP methyl ester carboxylesterase